jgi:tripartite-type tricarboxylate transporter receptor subunit TctC
MLPLSRPISRRLSLMALGMAPIAIQAQTTWPTKPVRMIVPYPSGGLSDNVARLLAERLASLWGQPVVIDNKPGASGVLGMDALAKSAPDGHTLAFSAISPLTLQPHLGKTPYDPLQDVTAVISVMSSPVLLMATPACPSRDLKELLQWARSRPGNVRWSTSGSASLGHIVLEQIRRQAQVDITHVPYKGGGQQITDALAGHVEVLSVNAGSAVLGHVKQGRLRALAVGAPTRMDSLPDIPTLAEAGFEAANLSSVFGVFAPARTPAVLIERVNLDIQRLLSQADVRARLLQSDNVPTGGNSSSFARHIAQELQHNARIIQSAQIRAD